MFLRFYFSYVPSTDEKQIDDPLIPFSMKMALKIICEPECFKKLKKKSHKGATGIGKATIRENILKQ